MQNTIYLGDIKPLPTHLTGGMNQYDITVINCHRAGREGIVMWHPLKPPCRRFSDPAQDVIVSWPHGTFLLLRLLLAHRIVETIRPARFHRLLGAHQPEFAVHHIARHRAARADNRIAANFHWGD